MAGVTTTTLHERDLDQVGPLCARAFDDYPLLEQLFDEPAGRAIVAHRLYTAIVADCVAHGTVDAAFDGDTLLGVAAWLPPGAYPLTLRRQLAMAGVVTAVLRHFPRRARLGLQAINRIEADHPTDEPHWYLATIAVDPPAQGRGIGSRLVRGVLDAADERGQACFLETTKESNRAWYHRLGFDTQTTAPSFDGGPPQWFMWRAPQPR